MSSPSGPGSSRSHTTRIVGGDRRNVGDAPKIGRVSKMHPGYDPHSPGSRGSRQPSQTPEITTTVLKRWIIAGVSLACLCVAALVTWVVTRPDNAPRKATVVNAAAAEARKVVVAPPATEMEAHTRAMLAATTPAALEKLIGPSAQEPAAMLEKLKNLATVDGKVTKVAYLAPIPSLTLPLESVLVTFDTGHNRIVLFTPDAAGKWRIDFDAFDRYTHPSWDTLLSGAAAEGTVRIYISPDSYYNGRFADEKTWSSFALASPDRETLMIGYSAKGGSCDRAIRKALEANREANPADPNPMLRMTLGVRRIASDATRQFEIVRVYSDDWAMGGKALDEQFVEEKKP